MSKNNQDNKTQSGLVLPKEWTAAFGPAGLDTTADSGFPTRWTLFGPVGKDDPEPDFAGMNAIPNELTIAGKRLAGQKEAFTDNRLDLGALLGGQKEGKTAYLLATVEAAKAMEIGLGAGADWWMKWWLNGEVVCDTLATGNKANPASVLDHRFTARFKAGRNLIAVKVVSGSNGFVLAADAPGGLFPPEWSLFGPVGMSDAGEPDFAGMATRPAVLDLSGRHVQAQEAVFDAANRVDLGALLGGAQAGRSAYLLAEVAVDRAMAVELGAGADWWMKWWVNGEVVCDTMEHTRALATGHSAHPPSIRDHRFTARLRPGRNVIAVKVVSGSASFALAAGEADVRGYSGAVTNVSTVTTLEPGTIYDRVWEPHIQRWSDNHLLATWGQHLAGKTDMGDILCSVSRDGGRTWMPAVTVFDHQEGCAGHRYAYANTVLYRAPGHNIVWCFAMRCPLYYPNSNESQLCAAYTADGGFSWVPVELANHFPSPTCCTVAPIKCGERYLLPVCRATLRRDPHGDGRTFVLESTDLISWDLAGFVPFDPENPVFVHEPGIALTDATTLTLVMRTARYDHHSYGPLDQPFAYSSQSTDGGRTWSQAVPEPKLHNTCSKGYYGIDALRREIYVFNPGPAFERKALHHCLREPGGEWSAPTPFFDDGNCNSYATLLEMPDNPGIYWCVWDGSDTPTRARTAIRFGILNLGEAPCR